MKDQGEGSKDKLSELRRRAELAAEKSLGVSDVSALSPQKVQQLIHELQVHQIELEVQNEELRRTQQELEASRDKYSDLYDFAPVGYLTLNEKGLILEANLTAVRLLGVERQGLTKMFFSRFVCQEFGDAYYLHLQQIFETRSKQTCEIELTKEDGSQFYAQLESEAVQDEGGEFSRCRTILWDITERKLREEKFLETARLNQTLIDRMPCVSLLLRPHTREIVASNEQAVKVGAVPGAQCFTTWGQREDPCPWCLAPKLWETGEAQHLEVEALGIVFDAYWIPISSDLYMHYAFDITDRKRSEDELRESQRKYKELVDNANSAIIRWSRDGTIKFFNVYAQIFFGYTADEVIGRHVNILVPEKDSTGSDLSTLVQDILNHPDRYVNIVNENICRDGRRVWMTWTNKPILDDEGQVVEILAVGSDITTQKHAEILLGEALDHLDTALKASSCVLYSCEPFGDYDATYISPNIERILGYAPDEFLQKGFWAGNVHPDDAPVVFSELSQLFNQGYHAHEYRFKHKNGSWRWIYDELKLRKNEQGESLDVLGGMTDITDRKQAEEAIRESEERFRLAMEATDDGVWDWDLKTDNVFRNPGFFSMLGYEDEEFRGLFGEWQNLVHPEDLKAVLQALNEYLNGTRENYEVEFRMFHRLGGEVWILSRGKVVARDANGEPLRMVGTHTDITDRKRAVEELRETSEYLQNLIGHANAPIIVWDPQYKITRFNRAFETLTGRKAEDVIGHSLEILFPSDQVECSMELIYGTMSGERWETVDISILNIDGSIHTVLWNSATILGADGLTPVATIAQGVDITERKRAEELLARANQEWQKTFDSISDLVMVLDNKHKILRANKAMADAFGMTEQEVIGKSCYELVHGEKEPPAFCPHSMLMADGEEHSAEIVEPRLGGIYDVRVSPVIDKGGRIIGSVHITHDITARKQSEEALSHSESMLRSVLQAASIGIGVVVNRVLKWTNEFTVKMTGYSQEELLGQSARMLYENDEEFERVGAFKYMQIAATGTGTVETKWKRKDGTIIDIILSSTAIDPQNLAAGVVFTAMDVTDRKRAEDALQKERDQAKKYLDIAGVMMVALSAEGNIAMINRKGCQILGYREEEIIGQNWFDICLPSEISKEATGGFEKLMAGEVASVEYYENPILRKDGEQRIVAFHHTALYDQLPQITGILFSGEDVTDRKVSDALIRVRLNLLEFAVSRSLEDLIQKTLDEVGLLTSSPIGFYHFMSEDEKTLSLQAWSTRTVKEFCQAEGKGRHYPVDEAGVWVDAVRERRPVIHNDYSTLPHRKGMPEGHAAVIRELVVPIMRSDRIVAVLGIGNKPTLYTEKDVEVVSYLADVAWEITERRRTEEALKERDKQYRTLFEESMDGVYSLLRDGEITDANPSFCELFGYSRKEMIGKDVRELYVDPADRPAFQKKIEKKGFVKDYEVKWRKRDGTDVDCLFTAAVKFADDGSVFGYRGILRDVTERKALQRQLLQAQKMEAVGTLAGGVAHDFNNLLQVVLGYSDLVLGDDDLPDQFRGDLEKIRLAGRNGADLVQRLLTFSRKTEPKFLDLNLNQRIRQTQKFLERTIPRMIDIEMVLADDLANIHADPTQVDQVLMNLAVNARDAMPEGGKLVIETANVFLDEECGKALLGAKPGEYVLMSMSDTGCGMDRQTLDHIFEPFYTTKEAGKGTGLGLSMVYGIVHQHGGYITCYSEPGEGTTFKCYFPAIEMEMNPDVAKTGIMAAFGTETILLVDDEEFLRDLGKRILERSGYTVLTAVNGEEALDLYNRERGKISLVILDLIMPEMGGSQCLEKLLRFDPKARILIASGYSADGPTKEVLQGGAKGFVSKPFDMRQLLQTVREVLDET